MHSNSTIAKPLTDRDQTYALRRQRNTTSFMIRETPVFGSQTENIVDHSYFPNTIQTRTLDCLRIEVQLQR